MTIYKYAAGGYIPDTPGSQEPLTFVITPEECLLDRFKVCQRLDDIHRHTPIPADRFWTCPVHDL